MGESIQDVALAGDEQYQKLSFDSHLSFMDRDLEIDRWNPKLTSVFGVEVFLSPNFANIEAWLNGLGPSMDFHDRDVLEVLDLVNGNDFSNYVSWWRRGPHLIRNDIQVDGYRFGTLAALPNHIDYIDFKFWQPWPGVVVIIAQCGLDEQSQTLINRRLEKPLTPYFVPSGQSQGLVGTLRNPYNQKIDLARRTIDEIKLNVRDYLRHELRGLFHQFGDLHDMGSFVDLVIHNGRSMTPGHAGFQSLEWMLGLECGPGTFGLSDDDGMWFSTRNRGRDTPARLRVNRELYAEAHRDGDLGKINDFQISGAALERFFEAIGLNAVVVALECIEGAFATLSRNVHAVELNSSDQSLKAISAAEHRLSDLRTSYQYLRQDYVSESRISSSEGLVNLWHRSISKEQNIEQDAHPVRLTDEYEATIEHQVKSVNSRISILINSVDYKSRALNQLQSSSLEQSNLNLQRTMLVLTLVLLTIALWPVVAWIGALMIDTASELSGHFRK